MPDNRTGSPFETLIEPMQQYGLAGMKPSQLRMYAGQPKRIARSALELQAAQRMAGEKPSDLKEVFGRPMRQVGHGLMSVLEYMDRPQDTVFSVVDDVLDGESDWNKIWSRAKANFTGAQDTNFAEILDHLPDDMKRSMTAAAVPVLFHGKKAFQDVRHGIGHAIESESFAGQGSAGMVEPDRTWENARQIYGVAGDVVLDPWNLVGGGALKLRKMAKLARAAGKFDTAAKLKMAAGVALDPIQTGIEGLAAGGRAAGRLALKSERVENLARATFMRGTGIKELDELTMRTGSRRGYVQSDIFDRTKAAVQSLDPLRKRYEDGRRIFSLAEERILKPVVRGADGLRIIPPDQRGAFTAKRASRLLDSIEALQKGSHAAGMQILADYEKFANPKNIQWWVKNYHPEDREAVLKALTDMRGMLDTRQAIRQAEGMRVPEIYERPIRTYQWATRAMNMAKTRAEKQAQDELDLKIKVAKKLIAGKEQAARRLVGAKVYREVLTAYKASPDVDALKRELKDAARRRLADLLGDIETKDMSALEKLQERLAGGQLTEVGEQELLESLASKASFQNLVMRQADAYRSIQMLPAYVPHIATEEVARELARNNPAMAGLRNALYDPNMANDMMREFVDHNGRSLSMEEVQGLHKARKISGLATRPKLQTAADVDLIEPSIVYKDEHLGKKVKRVFGKGDEREIAEFFDTDPAAVMAITGQRTAKSITAGEFVKGLVENGFIRREPLNDSWVPLNQIGHLGQMAKRFPELGNYFVTKQVGAHIARVADPYFGGMMSHPLVRAYDLSKRWGISYMLPLYPATWNRNALGNIMAMGYGGMWSNPLKFGQDSYQFLRGRSGQLHMMRGNLDAASKIKVNIRAMGARNETSFPEFFKIALKHGVAGVDYYGSEVKDLLSMQNPWKNWKHYAPGSTEFGLVRGGRQVMKWVEQGDRVTLFMHYLEDGYSPAQAAAFTKRYMGDFVQESLTPFERQWMTRLFPFYRWARYNVPLTVNELLFSPSSRYKLTALRRIHEELLEPETESGGRVRAWTPSFLQEVGGIPVDYDKKTGEMKFMALEGYIPAADIGNWLGGYDVAKWVLSQLTPPLQAGIEIGTRQSVFGGQKFEGRREMFAQQFPALMVHMMRKLRFLTELDRFDPFGSFHKARKQAPIEERLAKLVMGTGIYRTKPMSKIVEMQEDLIEQLRKEAGYLRSPSYRQNLDDWKDRQHKASQLLRIVEGYEDKERAENGHPVDTTMLNQAPIDSVARQFTW
jgi:hypothetical protein